MNALKLTNLGIPLPHFLLSVAASLIAATSFLSTKSSHAPQTGCDETAAAQLRLRGGRTLGGIGSAITASENSRAKSFAALCRNAEDPELLAKEEQMLVVLGANLRGIIAAAASSNKVRAIQRLAGSQWAVPHLVVNDEADADCCAGVSDPEAILFS